MHSRSLHFNGKTPILSKNIGNSDKLRSPEPSRSYSANFFRKPLISTSRHRRISAKKLCQPTGTLRACDESTAVSLLPACPKNLFMRASSSGSNSPSELRSKRSYKSFSSSSSCLENPSIFRQFTMNFLNSWKFICPLPSSSTTAIASCSTCRQGVQPKSCNAAFNSITEICSEPSLSYFSNIFRHDSFSNFVNLRLNLRNSSKLSVLEVDSSSARFDMIDLSCGE
mmetsp:Transcript_117131/g.185325  ORF Transcript_117131/g.185325 Transcript_117131/m.185325 type:complete len:226 (-) Transcript_117131:600-1277(-)